MSDLQLKLRIQQAYGLQKGDKNSSDPFVVAKFKGLGKMMNSVQTSVIHNTLNPVWNQELTLYPKTAADVLLLKVYDHDTLTKDNLLGMVEVPLERFFQQGTQDNWLQLMRKKGSWKAVIGGHPTWYTVPGQLQFSIWFGLASSSIAQQGTGLAQNQTFNQPQQYTNIAPKSMSVDPVQMFNTGFQPITSPYGQTATGFSATGAPLQPQII